jgi:hypothetical protein
VISQYASPTVSEGEAVDQSPPTESQAIVETARVHPNGLERLLHNALHSEVREAATLAWITGRTIRRPNSHRAYHHLLQWMPASALALTAMLSSVTPTTFHTRIAILQAARILLWRNFPTSQTQAMTRLFRLGPIKTTQISNTLINLRLHPTSKLSSTRSSCTSCRN